MAHLKLRKNSFLSRRVFGGLEKNALGCVIFEPMWGIFGGMIFYYMPLYMKALGVNEVYMGSLNSLAAFMAVITAFVSGPVTDRLGRKRTTLIFDLIGWGITMLLWAVSQNVYFFLAAVITNSFTKFSFTSWTCLAIEDTPEEKRSIFFSLIMVINLGSGIFTPIAGMLIYNFGIVTAMRGIFAVGCVSMVMMFLSRNMITEETSIGRQLIEKHSSISYGERVRDYVDAMKFMVTNRSTLLILFIVLLTNFQLSFQFFHAMYLKDGLGFSTYVVSLIPAVSAVVNLLIHFLFMPGLIRSNSYGSLILGLTLCCTGATTLLFVNESNFPLLLISTILAAAGNIIMNVFRDTLWNGVIGEGERAKIFSACQGIIGIISIPSGLIAGVLYRSNARYPFIISSCIFAFCVLISIAAFKSNAKKDI